MSILIIINSSVYCYNIPNINNNHNNEASNGKIKTAYKFL